LYNIYVFHKGVMDFLNIQKSRTSFSENMKHYAKC
jgi:hypothetical protein